MQLKEPLTDASSPSDYANAAITALGYVIFMASCWVIPMALSMKGDQGSRRNDYMWDWVGEFKQSGTTCDVRYKMRPTHYTAPGAKQIRMRPIERKTVEQIAFANADGDIIELRAVDWMHLNLTNQNSGASVQLERCLPPFP